MLLSCCLGFSDGATTVRRRRLQHDGGASVLFPFLRLARSRTRTVINRRTHSWGRPIARCGDRRLFWRVAPSRPGLAKCLAAASLWHGCCHHAGRAPRLDRVARELRVRRGAHARCWTAHASCVPVVRAWCGCATWVSTQNCRGLRGCSRIQHPSTRRQTPPRVSLSLGLAPAAAFLHRLSISHS